MCGSRWVVGMVVVTSAALVCGGAAAQAPAATAAAGHRFVHIHEFPDLGVRLAPPTGHARLPWQRAVRTAAVRGFFDARRLPEVKLADYSDRFQGPMRPVLAWVVVDPRAEVVEHGPDFAARAAGGRDRCPLYVFVDAATGRGYGAIQTCQPPYRG